MNKPSTIIYEEFRQELANTVNKSGLPAFVIELVLRDYLDEIIAIRQKQYQADMAEYEAYLNGSQEKQ